MTINSKQKGARSEREVAEILREYGFENARRTCQFSGKGEGTNADVIGLEGIHIEVKNREHLNIYEAIEQAIRDSANTENIPTVFHKKNNKPWLFTMKLSDFLILYNELLWLRKKFKEENK